MKFPVDKCGKCGIDLTTAEPEPVVYQEGKALVPCPKCYQVYEMVEVTPPPTPEPVVEPTPEPEPPTTRGGRRRASEPEPESKPAEEPEPPPEE